MALRIARFLLATLHMMKRGRCSTWELGLATALVFLMGGGAEGQAPQPRANLGSTILGVWFSAESLPRAMDPNCGNSQGHRESYALGALVVIPVGRLSLRGSAGVHRRPEFFCSGVLIDRNGIYTIPSSRLAAGDFATTELVLQTSVRNWFVFGLGGGWAWSKNVPYLTSIVGVRFGRGLRLGGDLEITSFRVPWISRTAEYEEGFIVSVLADDFYHDWGSAWSLSFVLDLPVSRGN